MSVKSETPCGQWISRSVAEMTATRYELLLAAEALETMSDRTAVISAGKRCDVAAMLRTAAKRLDVALAPF